MLFEHISLRNSIITSCKLNIKYLIYWHWSLAIGFLGDQPCTSRSISPPPHSTLTPGADCIAFSSLQLWEPHTYEDWLIELVRVV